MKHILLTIFVLLSCVGTYLYLRDQKKEEKAVVKNEAIAKRLFLGKRNQFNTDTKETSSKESDSCNKLKVALNDLDFTQKDIRLESLDLSCDLPEIVERIKRVKEICGQVSNDCLNSLVFLRAVLRTQNLKEAMTQEEIADSILKEFSKKVPDFKILQKLAEKLLDINPSDKKFQELWAMAKLLSNDLQKLPVNLAEEIYGKVDPSLWEGSQMKGLQVILESGMNAKKMESFLLNDLKKNPNDSFSYELLGFALWKQNRRQEALESLDKAIALNPKDEWLRKMRKDLNSEKADVHSYQGRLSLGVNIDDLFL